eukprot:5908224-Amphidinium_carterae.1
MGISHCLGGSSTPRGSHAAFIARPLPPRGFTKFGNVPSPMMWPGQSRVAPTFEVHRGSLLQRAVAGAGHLRCQCAPWPKSG